MELDLLNLLVGVVVVSAFGVLSIMIRIVNISGAIAGFFVGLFVFIFGGWKWFLIILTFHLIAGSSTKFRYQYKKSKGVAEERLGARGWENVLANGGIATMLSIIEGITPSQIFFIGFLGAVSTAFTDTLATEIGVLYPHAPRLITNMKKVPTGTSGAISPFGELAVIGGAIVIGSLSCFLDLTNLNLQTILLIALIGGFSGTTLDSVIGATIQAMYKCQVCGKIVEKGLHCDTPTIHLKGIRLFNNNVVNLCSTAFGAITAILTYLMLGL